MMSRILIILMIIALINVSVVNSQEECPPDCTSSGKITEESYLNHEVYKNKDFYKYSDPNKWDFSNPNFDYNKIPLERYKNLPYDNPSIDHSRLDSNKYICAMGCCTCTFLLRTTQVKYAVDGVMHPKTGLAKIPSDYPPLTLFIADRDRIIIVLPSIGQHKLDINNVGSATIFTNNKEVTLSNGLTINGKLSFVNDKPFVAKNEELTVEGINIKPKGNDVFVYFDGKSHNGNYVSYGQNNLIAEGNKFDLEFTSENKLVKVFSDNLLSAIYKRVEYEVTELAQSDYLYFSLGNGESKNGKLELTERYDRNLLPLVKTEGYARIWNDRNDLIVDDNQLSQKYYKTLPYVREGSVSMQMIVDDDAEKLYTFDENRRIMAIDKKTADKIDFYRSAILKDFNTILTGFFDESDLQGFVISLYTMETDLDIDFQKIEKIKGRKMEIIESDKRLESQGVEARAQLGGSKIFWKPSKRDDSYKVSTYQDITIRSFHANTIAHEIGHVLTSSESTSKFIQKGREFGILFVPVEKGIELNQGPDEYFPGVGYGKKDISEFQAEIFETILRDPDWFKKADKISAWVQVQPKVPGQLPEIERKEIPIPKERRNEVLKVRNTFKNIWLEELRKYKK